MVVKVSAWKAESLMEIVVGADSYRDLPVAFVPSHAYTSPRTTIEPLRTFFHQKVKPFRTRLFPGMVMTCPYVVVLGQPNFETEALPSQFLYVLIAEAGLLPRAVNAIAAQRPVVIVASFMAVSPQR